MSIWDFCIKRPVFTTVLMLSLVLLGVMGYTRMGVDLMPDFDVPVASVTVTYVGADPEVIDQDVTDTIEEQVGTLEGIKSINSSSYEGYASIVVEFELNRNIDVATQEVRDKVSLAKRDLPTGIEEPIVQKVDPDSSPILYLSLYGDLPYQRLSQLADDVLKDRIQNVNGVGSVQLYGFRERNVRIWLNARALEKYGIGPADVAAALNAWHVELPGGRVETDRRESTIKMKGEYSDVEDLKTMAVAWRGGAAIRLKDIARVEDGEEDSRTEARFEGQPCITLAVVKQSGANTVGICHEVIEKIPEFRTYLPESTNITVTYDTSEFIKNSVEGVRDDMLLGGLFTVIVVYLFLRNVKMTLVSIMSIPISLVGCFGFMYFMDFTINQITMLAMSLAVGMVIDDTIVVSENIFRQVEEGSEPEEASSRGTREVAFAVLASTMTVAAIFLPIAFMGGVIGRIFYQFGISIGIAITLSYIVSITMTPMLCASWLNRENSDNFFTRAVGNFLKWLDEVYRHYLDIVLRNRFTRVMAIIFAFACFGVAVYLVRFVGTEFSPNADESAFMVAVKTPVGTSLTLTDQRVKAAAAIVRKWPEVTTVMEMVGNPRTSLVNEGTLMVKLKPRKERKKSQEQIMSEMRSELTKIPGSTVIPSYFPKMSGQGGRTSDVTFTLSGPNLDTLQDIAAQIDSLIKSNSNLRDADNDLELTKPQIYVYPKRDAAADVSLNTSAITNALQLMMGGVDAAKFKIGSKRYDVRIKAEDSYRTSAEAVGNIVIRTGSGKSVKIREVADISEGIGPNIIKRYDRMRAVTITCNVVPGKITSGDAQDWLEKEVNKILVKYPGYHIQATGMSKVQRESMGYMLFAIFSSIIIVYLVLAAQFESYIHPLTIMMTLPLAMIGVFVALLICHENLSIFALIGIIMLVGIVTKNGILLVEFANQLRDEEGLDAHHAMLKAGPLRLRPILMTAVSTIMGVVPIALALSEGSEARSAMGVAVIGGLSTSTFLTLFIVPTAYITFDGIMARFYRLIGVKEKKSGPKPGSGGASSETGAAGPVKADGRGIEEIRRGKVIADSEDRGNR